MNTSYLKQSRYFIHVALLFDAVLIHFSFVLSGYEFLPQSLGEARRGLPIDPHPPSNSPQLAQAPLRFLGGEQENQRWIGIILVAAMLMAISFSGQTALALTAQWTLFPTDKQNTPSPRVEYGMAYDSHRGVVILHSGLNFVSLFHDTWEWDGQTWKKVTEAGPGRNLFGMAFDPSRNVTVLYGGHNAWGKSFNKKTYSSVTWEWDGKEWKGIDTVDMGIRVCTPLVYDPELKSVIRHGGISYYGGPIFNDTWKWDGAMWTQIAVGPKRFAHRMVYDSIRKKVVLFGGSEKAGSDPSDTWEFDGTNWVQVSTVGPPGREVPGFAFDISRGVAVLFGGNRYWGFSDTWIGDTWEWDGKKWTQIESIWPGTTYTPDMAYDSQRKKIVLFRGGGGGKGREANPSNLVYQETWEYGALPSGIPFTIWSQHQ